ncbi:MAG: phosphoribosylanthranilate isomerase [Acidobacteriota bacterium]
MTAVKFCGMRRPADVGLAVTLDVQALGFVLWPGSPRYVTAAQAAGLIKAMPDGMLAVGVIVNPTQDDVKQAVDAGVHVLQVYGKPGAAIAQQACDVWVAAALSANGLTQAVDHRLTVLLDAQDPVRHGGTGQTIDWGRAADISAKRRVVLAGGLTPANVGEAVRRVRPYGVDVASGIEVQPGIKDPDAMRAFVVAVRGAEA